MNLFNEETQTSALTILKRSLEIGYNEAGTMVVFFRLTEGKGTGLQSVPVSEFPDFVDTLVKIEEEGIVKQSVNYTSVDLLKKTIAVDDDGMVSFRLTTGQGAKPTRFKETELGDIVSFLRGSVQPRVNNYMRKLEEEEAKVSKK